MITTPPYLRAGCCHCEEEGLPGGGWLDPPRNWSQEEIEKAKQEYARTHDE